MQDLIQYRGKKVSQVVKILTGLGYNVIVNKNLERVMNNADELVVEIREIQDKQIEIISGSFKFLTKK